MAKMLKHLVRLVLSYWRLMSVFLVPLCLAPILILSEERSARAGYLLLLMTCFLVFELLPIPATILLVLFLVPTVGLATTAETALYFTTDTMFLFIAVLMMAISIEEVDLHNRLALLALRAIGVSSSKLILGFLLISGCLSMWMSNVAVTMMILPIAKAVTDTLSPDQEKEEEPAFLDLPTVESARRVSVATYPVLQKLEAAISDDANPLETARFLQRQNSLASARSVRSIRSTQKDISTVKLIMALQLSICYGANVGGMATLIGSYNNMLLRMTMESNYGTDTNFNFLSFALVATPIAFGSLFITWVVFCLLFIPNWITSWRRQDSSAAKSQRLMDDKLKQLGPIKHGEVSVLLVFTMVISLWLTRDPKVAPGWSIFFKPKFATDAMPALLGAVLLFIIPLDFKEFARGAYEPILTWKRVVVRFPWEFLLFAGGLMAIMKLSEISGFITAVGQQVPDLRSYPPLVIATIVSLIAATGTEVMSGAIISAVLLPIFANLAEDTGVNPLYYMIAIVLSSQMSFLTPISSFPTLVVYGAGTVRLLDMFRAGLAPKMACLTLQILSLEFLGWAVLDIKTFPEWAEVRYASRRQMLYNVSTISSASTVYNGPIFGNVSVIDALGNTTSVI
ncbi:hypothetical protein RvY_13480 [Ramazzottius varieornatus]|uniref:Citrate transporter-like domain-containing protein n=1 Tax=Ramazzottius varieornatus TaxID=947166 RepID=A0A1D1VN13_RAMVA|nr:hypothetical protein RvY_13480 [Ramazzottius varieornatus]